MTALVIAAARPEHAEAVTAVIRDGFSAEVQRMTIYGCPGAAEFVRREIALGPALAERAFTVALDGGTVAGAIELRRLPAALFLNYVAVAPGYHGSGLAAALLASAVSGLRTAAHREMLLDVFPENSVARGWYERLGFAAGTTTEWHALDLAASDSGAATGAVLVGGFAQAEACHEAFGFSHLTLETARGRYGVGRLGDAWFRVTDAAALADPAVAPALAALDPARRVLALLPAGAVPDRLAPRARRVATTVRMSVALDALAERLQRRLGRAAETSSQPPDGC